MMTEGRERPVRGRKPWIGALTALAALVTVGSAAALDQYGPRVGISSDPDQFTLGAFTDWGELAPDVVLKVNADIGFGDDVLTFTINGDVLYEFVNAGTSFLPYAGGGIGYAYYDLDLPSSPLPGFTFDDTFHEIGLNLVAGIETDLGGYKTGAVEIRIGISDVPDVKVTAQLGFF